MAVQDLELGTVCSSGCGGGDAVGRFGRVAGEEEANADVEEVVKYVRALDAGIEMAPRVPLGIRVIRTMHGILLDGVPGRERRRGELRRSQNWIGAPGATPETAIFVPPPPDELGDLLADWERFANEEDNLPALVSAALLHRPPTWSRPGRR